MAGLATRQPPRPAHPALGDERDGDGLERLEIPLDALAARPAAPASAAPPLAGMLGSVAARTAKPTALTVTASTALTFPRCCGDEPVKSNTASSSATVRRTATRAASAESSTSVKDHEPSGSEVSADLMR